MTNKKELKVDLIRFGKGSKRKPKSERHPAGGYYHEGQKGGGDPDRGLSPSQKKSDREFYKHWPKEPHNA